MMLDSWLAILPHMLLAGGAVVVYLCGALRPQRQGLAFALSLAVLVLAIDGAAIAPARGVAVGLLDTGAFSRFYTLLLLFVSLGVLLLLQRYAHMRRLAGEVLYGTLLLATLGMIDVVGASHWLVFFVSFELLSLSLYILIAIRRDQTMAYEAGIKYFVMGAVASSFLVFGLGLLYAATGTLSISASLAALAENEDVLLALPAFLLILAGVGFKISLVPFHLWTPDVYEGAPAPITALLATGSKLAVIGALVRFFSAVPVIPQSLITVLWLLAAATMLIGNLTALVQEKVKRLLAYSSIAHMGYMLMALLAGGQQGFIAVLFYSVIYALMDLGAFGSLGLMSPKIRDLNDLQYFQALGYRRPWSAALLTLSLLTLAGLPPTGGFFGKFMLFTAAFKAGFPWLAGIGLLSALVSIFYYQKVIVTMYLREGRKTRRPISSDWAGGLACSVIFALILWFGIMPAGLLAVVEQALSLN